MAATMKVLVGTAEGLMDAAWGRTVAFEGHDVVAVSGGWAVLDGKRLATLQGGLGPAVDGPRVNCVDAQPGAEPLVGTADAHLYRVGAEARRVDSFEGAEDRDQWYTPWGGPPDVRSLCTTATGAVLVNVHVGGILRSGDGAASWRATIDLHADVHQVLAHDGMAFAACALGLAASHDDGNTWSLADEGLHATYSRAVTVAGHSVLLSVSGGPGGHQAAVYRRALGAGGGFQRCRTGLPEWFDGNVDTFCLAGAPDGSAALGTRSGDVYLSTDEGAAWDLAASGLPTVRCVTLG